MKIAYDYQIFTNQKYGGISRYYTQLATELEERKDEVRVFSGLYCNYYLSQMSEHMIFGRKLSSYPPKTKRLFKVINHFYSNRAIEDWRPDVIHETYYSSCIKPNVNIPRVATVHDMIHELYRENFSLKDKTISNKINTLNRVDHIISISHNTKKDLINLYNIDESKITVIHHGVDSRFLNQPKTNEINLQFPYILFVGSRRGYKNFINLLKACSASNRIKNKIKIIAFGGGYFNNTEKSMIKQLGFKNDYVLNVVGNDDQLSSIYARAKCFVYPSLYEGFGLPLLEAMASGCPVLCSNTSSLPEIAGNAALYFNPLSFEEIKNSIEQVIENEALRMQLITSGYENIKKYSWEKCALETHEVYSKLK